MSAATRHVLAASMTQQLSDRAAEVDAAITALGEKGKAIAE